MLNLRNMVKDESLPELNMTGGYLPTRRDVEDLKMTARAVCRGSKASVREVKSQYTGENGLALRKIGILAAFTYAGACM